MLGSGLRPRGTCCATARELKPKLIVTAVPTATLHNNAPADNNLMDRDKKVEFFDNM